MTARHILKMLRHGYTYGVSMHRLARLVSTPSVKLSRRHAQRLLEQYAKRWAIKP